MTDDECKKQLGLVWKEGKPTEPGRYLLAWEDDYEVGRNIRRNLKGELYYHGSGGEHLMVSKESIIKYAPIPDPIEPPKIEDVLWEEKGKDWYDNNPVNGENMYRQGVRDALEWVKQQEEGEL
jgi:hypothetical protein